MSFRGRGGGRGGGFRGGGGRGGGGFRGGGRGGELHINITFLSELYYVFLTMEESITVLICVETSIFCFINNFLLKLLCILHYFNNIILFTNKFKSVNNVCTTRCIVTHYTRTRTHLCLVGSQRAVLE